MLSIKFENWKKWRGPGRTLVCFAFMENIPADAAADGFKGKALETLLYRPAKSDPAERVILIGLGKRSEFSNEVLRRAASKGIRAGESLGLNSLHLKAPQIARATAQAAEIQALAEGLHLSAYRFDRYKTQQPDSPKPVTDIMIWVNGSTAFAWTAAKKAEIFSRGTLLARDLINEPPSRMNPARLAEEAMKFQRTSVSVTVFEVKDLERMGMGGLLGVGVGGAVAPRLVEIIYRPPRKAKKVVALVGKGITFDSGGLSLKPAASMETMKDDMSGAAAVLGVMSVLADLKPEAEVRGYMAIAENMPGGRAQKPGDVLRAFNGKTIEVLNTDAEGRLVLSDALSYACSKKPDILIDIATLTGACVVALGHRISAIMTNTPSLAGALKKAGETAGEKFWELPLEKEYAEDVKSKIADVQNIGKRRGEAGTIIGGLFLKEFVDERPWAHIDIAGPSWTDSDQPYCPTGGTGHPVRTLLHYIESL